MADSTMKIDVDVTDCIHKGLKDILQKMASDHGIRIENISVDWDMVQALGCRPDYKLKSIIINSKSDAI